MFYIGLRIQLCFLYKDSKSESAVLKKSNI